MVSPEEITKKVNEAIAKYIDTSAIYLNKLIDGSSVNRPNATTAVAIQKLVKRLNGSGLKVTIFFLLLLKMMADILKFTETPIPVFICIQRFLLCANVFALCIYIYIYIYIYVTHRRPPRRRRRRVPPDRPPRRSPRRLGGRVVGIRV